MDNARAFRAEQSLLGCLMLDNRTWDRIADVVTATDFSRSDHRTIFEAIATQATRGDHFDILTLADALEAKGELRRLEGGMAFLSTLESTTPSAAGAKRYASLVREQSVLRQLVAACTEITDEARDGECDVTDLLDTAGKRVGAIAEQSIRGPGALDMRGLLKDAVEHLQAVCERGGKLLGISTGYRDLDAKTAGLQPQDLIILAGRPSMGKSTLAMNIAETVALTAEKPAMVFSLEMSARALTLRMLSSQGRIDHGKLRAGDLGEDEWSRVTATTMRLNAAKLHIDDAAGLTLSDITARARRLHRESGGLALIVIDYLQLITTRGKTESRNLEVSAISAGLKGLAKSLDCPVVALSQLSRGVESRASKRPMMSDLRDSGSIEQDADLIVFLYRDEVYNEDSADKGTAEIIISKQRNGETGTLRMAFAGQHCRFDDLAQNWTPREREPMKSGGSRRREY
jgi:replicative DNA helicase